MKVVYSFLRNMNFARQEELIWRSFTSYLHNFLKRGYLYESRKKSTTKKQNVLRAKEHETKKIKNKILSKGEK